MPHKKKPTKIITFILILLLIGMIFTPSLVVIFILGMLPSFLAYIIDTDPKKSLFISIMMPNLSGVILILGIAYQYYPIWGPVVPEIYERRHWAVIYAAAFLGLILYWIIPELFILAYRKTLQAKIAFLVEKKEQLAERYGAAIDQNIDPSTREEE